MSQAVAQWNKDLAMRYIKTIDLPATKQARGFLARTAPPLPFSDISKPGDYINDGMIISVSDSLNDREARYVQSSTLLASLAAKNKIDRFSQQNEWYNAYFDVLTHCGWIGIGSGMEKFEAGGSKLDVNKAIIKILSSLLLPNQILAIQAALESLQKMADDDGRIVLWDHSTRTAKCATFQIAGASKDNNNILLKMAACYFITTQDTKKFLWATYSTASIDFERKTDHLQLDLNALNSLENVIKDKVEPRLKDYIAKISI